MFILKISILLQCQILVAFVSLLMLQLQTFFGKRKGESTGKFQINESLKHLIYAHLKNFVLLCEYYLFFFFLKRKCLIFVLNKNLIKQFSFFFFNATEEVIILWSQIKYSLSISNGLFWLSNYLQNWLLKLEAVLSLPI